MNKKSVFLLIVLTPVIFWLTHVIGYLIHEYCHSVGAWLFGFKQNPWALHYGDTSLENLLTLDQVSENVDFESFAPQHPWVASFSAVAGFGIGNVFLLLVSLLAIHSKKQHGYLFYYFFMWLAVMNLGNFIDYVPGRVFGTHGDMQEIVSFLQISPWWLMVVLGYPICYSFWFFYSKTLPMVYQKMRINRYVQTVLLVLVTWTLFALFGMAGQHGYGPESHLVALLSLYITPIVIIACWPWRDWVRKKVGLVKK